MYNNIISSSDLTYQTASNSLETDTLSSSDISSIKATMTSYKTTSLKDRYINKAIERARRKYPGVTFNKEEIYFMANEYCPRCGNKLSYGYNSKYSPTLIIQQDGSIAIICRICRNI